MKRNLNILKWIDSLLYNRALYKFSIISEVLLLIIHFKTFKKTYSLLQKSQKWNHKQIEKYQLKQLRKLLIHSYENVPYYNRMFNKIGINPEDIHTIKDMQKLPYLTKDLVRKYINDLKARNYPEYKFNYFTTGGSTGIPLGFYDERGNSYVKEVAFFKTLLDRSGCKLGDRFIVLRGDVIPKGEKGKFWKYSLFRRYMFLSSYLLTEKNLPKYIEKIRKFKPKFFLTYPSSLTFIAKYMKKNNTYPFTFVNAIFSGAENLYDWQRDLLEETFCCKIFDIYGISEQAVYAASCECSSYLHIYPEYGIVELIDKDGELVTKENETGEIVVTGFKNFIFPFIRYKTGDVGTNTIQKCTCGRNYPLLKRIDGRLQEFIITKNNRHISIAAINMHTRLFDNVHQFQFYQEKKSEVVLRIVKQENFSGRDSHKIYQEISKKLGSDIELHIEYVDRIQRTFRGKHKFLIQKLQIEKGESRR